MRYIAILMFLPSLAVAQELQLPAFGLTDLEEGTVEAWVMVPSEPASVEARWLTQGTLLNLNAEPHYKRTGLSVAIAVWQQRLVARLGVQLDGRDPNDIPAWGRCVQKAHVWQHVAFVWRGGDTIAWYLNGQHTYTNTLDVHFDRPLASSATLTIGGRRSIFAIDDYRLSTVARNPDDMGYHGQLKPDAATALLLTFDEGDAPYAIVPAAGDLTLPKAVKPIDGKFGRAIAWPVPDVP